MPSPVALLQSAMPLMSRLAPRLTGRLMFELFCLVPRPRLNSEHQIARMQQSEQALGKGRRLDIDFQGGHVATWHFSSAITLADGPVDTARPSLNETPVGGDKRRTVLLLHGFTSRAAWMVDFIEPLLAAGFDVLLVDLPAHGESSGRRIHIPRAVESLLSVQAVIGPWQAVVAHSFGGMVFAAMAAGTLKTHAPQTCSCAAVLAAPASASRVFEGFARFMKMGFAATEAMKERVLALSGVPIEQFEADRQLESQSIPLLCLHDPDDKEVPFDATIVWQRAGAAVVSTPGTGHRRLLRDRDAVDKVVEFVSKTLDETGGATVHAPPVTSS